MLCQVPPDNSLASDTFVYSYTIVFWFTVSFSELLVNKIQQKSHLIQVPTSNIYFCKLFLLLSGFDIFYLEHLYLKYLLISHNSYR